MSYYDATSIPPELRAMIENELQSGERITWTGQPIPGRTTKGSWGIILFGIPWTAFAVFWTYMASGPLRNTHHNPGPIGYLFPLFGVPFILIGLAMLSSPFWLRRMAARTVYVLTDRRAILFTGGLRRGSMTVRSFQPDQLRQLQRNQNSDGTGDLIFTQDIDTGKNGNQYPRDVGFIGIRDVKQVEELVRNLAAQTGTNVVK